MRDELSVELVTSLISPSAFSSFSFMNAARPDSILRLFKRNLCRNVNCIKDLVSCRISCLSLQYPLDPKNRYHSLQIVIFLTSMSCEIISINKHVGLLIKDLASHSMSFRFTSRRVYLMGFVFPPIPDPPGTVQSCVA